MLIHFLMFFRKRPTTEECLENKWLLPNEFMIKKREHAVFLSHNLRDFSERFHSQKGKSTPNALLNIFGKSESRYHSFIFQIVLFLFSSRLSFQMCNRLKSVIVKCKVP